MIGTDRRARGGTRPGWATASLMLWILEVEIIKICRPISPLNQCYLLGAQQGSIWENKRPESGLQLQTLLLASQKTLPAASLCKMVSTVDTGAGSLDGLLSSFQLQWSAGDNETNTSPWFLKRGYSYIYDLAGGNRFLLFYLGEIF